jgi:YTH domain-containing family protein
VNAKQFNRDEFPVDHPNAKFYVIKSYSEDDAHKSIKYGVWSSTPNGNRRLDAAYMDAQRGSSGNSKGCPVFLFFSVFPFTPSFL